MASERQGWLLVDLDVHSAASVFLRSDRRMLTSTQVHMFRYALSGTRAQITHVNFNVNFSSTLATGAGFSEQSGSGTGGNCAAAVTPPVR